MLHDVLAVVLFEAAGRLLGMCSNTSVAVRQRHAAEGTDARARVKNIISRSIYYFGNIPPRCKHFHCGGNILIAVEIVFHLIHNFPLDSLQRNFRDFIVFT